MGFNQAGAGKRRRGMSLGAQRSQRDRSTVVAHSTRGKPAMAVVTDDELETVSGGMKNADIPGVAIALNAFYSTLYCGGTTQLPPTTIAYPDGSVGKTGGGSTSNCSPA
jgi:hypothetical protein